MNKKLYILPLLCLMASCAGNKQTESSASQVVDSTNESSAAVSEVRQPADAIEGNVYTVDFNHDGKTGKYEFVSKGLSEMTDNEDAYDATLVYDNGTKKEEIVEGALMKPTILSFKHHSYLMMSRMSDLNFQDVITSIYKGDTAVYDSRIAYIEKTNDTDFEMTYEFKQAGGYDEDGFGYLTTYNTYWGYDAADGLHEYGAIALTEAQFLKFVNAANVLAQIKSFIAKAEGCNANATEFLYRSNGIININLMSKGKGGTRLFYANVEYDGNNNVTFKEPKDETQYTGSYQKAIEKEMAVYPTLPEFLK